MLGAALAPALVRHSGPDPESAFLPSLPPSPRQGRWTPDQVRGDGKGEGGFFAVTNRDRALKKYQKAEAALAAVARTDDEALYDRLGDRHGVYPERLQGSRRAPQRLLLTLAPTIAALALKLDLALYEPASEFTADLAAMRALKADARRLASTG